MERDQDENRDFQEFKARGDAEALARVFDAVAPRLLLLAAHFARDAAEAEDLVQTTFLHALRDADSFDGTRPVASWLAGILRHRALDLLRARRRRPEDMEVDASLVASAAGPAELAQRRDLFERVVQALEAVDEPFRTVLLMRLVHGIEPKSIAHTLGRPPGTVRMQLMRGLEKLRAALPNAEALLGGAFGAIVIGEGTRGLGAVRGEVLASARGAPAAAVVGGAWLASIGAKVAALVLVAGVVLVAVLALRSQDPQLSEMQSVVSEASTFHASDLDVLVATSEPNREPVEVAEVALTPLDSAIQTQHVVFGRVLLHDGTPAADVPILARLHARASGSTDAEGRFALALDAVAGEEGRISISPANRIAHAWPLTTSASSKTDVGDLVYPRGGRIEGSIVDGDGRAIAIAAQVAYSMPSAGRGSVATDPYTGRFELLDVPPDAPVWFTVDHAAISAAEVQTSVELGGTSSVLLVHTGEPPSWRIGARVVVPYIDMDMPTIANHARLRLPDGSTREPLRSQRVYRDGYSDEERFDIVFAAEGASEFTLTIDDPRFEAVHVGGLRAGEDVRVELRGGARLIVHASSDDTGPEPDELRAEIRIGSAWTDRWMAIPFTRLEGGVWRSDPIPAQMLAVRVVADGYTAVDLSLNEPLATGEERNVECRFVRAGRLAGTVRRANGEPLAGVDVLALQALPAEVLVAEETDPTAVSRWTSSAVKLRGTTDADGRFAFEGAPFERWDLRLSLGDHLRTWKDGVSIKDGDVDITMPAFGTLEGRVISTRGVLPPGIEVHVQSDAPLLDAVRSMTLALLLKSGSTVPIADDGTFRVEAIAAGRVAVQLATTSMRASGPLPGSAQVSTHGERTWVEVAEGSVTFVELDASDALPVHATVEVSQGGSPIPGLRVAAHQTTRPWEMFSGFASTGTTDSNGRAQIVLKGDGPWSFRVSDSSATWAHAVPGSHALDANGAIEVATDFALSAGRLLLVDEEDQPIARSAVLAYDVNEAPIWVETDANGEFVGTMAIGRYEFGVVSGAERIDGIPVVSVASRTTVDWTNAGPVPARIVVVRPP